MSLSLSSLLNPSEDNAAGPPSPPVPSSNSHPLAEPGAQLYDDRHHQSSASPTSTRPVQQYVPTPTTAHEAAQALAALSASPGLTSSQWFAGPSQDQMQSERRFSNERRPGSGQGEPLQLPLPLPQTGSARKMSSPTLEQYQVASRSPEQRRMSQASPTRSNITLPPLQAFATSSGEYDRRTSFNLGHERPAMLMHETPSNHTIPHSTMPSAPTAEQVATLGVPSHLGPSTAQAKPVDDGGLSPAMIKQEKMTTPQPGSPPNGRRTSEIDQQSLKTVTSLKTEHGARTQSPLRESSIPLPTTEVAQIEQSGPTKKRPASAKTKKGTATTMKKAPATKKRKLETVRSATPLSHLTKPNGRTTNGKGTPANSSPAPSTRSYSAEPTEEADDDDEDEDMDDDPDADVYCICRRPDNGTFMIGCDGTCDDWFHGKCVGINERDKNLIDKYVCPSCTKAGVGRTTWKRMCRRHGCRQPARAGKVKGGNGGRSKYCSDECGILYYQELAERTRGREEVARSRNSRRKGSTNHSDKPPTDDDLGARGGPLAAGEVKALLNASKTASDFHSLGDGVLSPPATPDGENNDPCTASEQQALVHIHTQKEEARHRHVLLKDRMKFVTMVKQAASRVATEKELKPKEYCGYDSRLEWTEAQFQRWRHSKAGQQAFELETLASEPNTNGTAMDVDPTPGHVDDDSDGIICDRKKCARHLEWTKLAVDDLRFEMSDNGDRMRALDREEKAIRERAALRVKAGDLAGEGTVEVHALPDRVGPDESIESTRGSEAINMPKPNEQIVMETVEMVDAVPPMAIGAS